MTSRLSGVAVCAVGVAAAVLARRLPAPAGFGLGPAFLPFWTGLVLAACGAWLCVRPSREGAAAAAGARGLGRAAGGLAALLVYALALEPLGYLLSTAAFLAGGMVLLEPRRSGRALGVGIVGAAFLLLVFRVWLRVPLPGGVLGW